MGTATTLQEQTAPPPGVHVLERPVCFQRVLVASDFSPASERAFRFGVQLCKKLGARMALLHVFEYGSILLENPGGELEELLVKARQWMDKYIAVAMDEGVVCEALLEGGFPPESILAVSEARGSDLVVLGTNGFRGFGRLVFGSTAEAVMRSSACPVLTMGPRVQPGRAGPVVFATDFHSATRRAIELAHTMCAALGVPLHLVHVLPRSVEEDASGNVIPHIMQQALEHLEGDGDAERPVCAVVYGSEVSQAVVEYARQHDASAIVLGVRRRSLLAAHAPAQIAFRMIAEASCPVVTWCLLD